MKDQLTNRQTEGQKDKQRGREKIFNGCVLKMEANTLQMRLSS